MKTISPSKKKKKKKRKSVFLLTMLFALQKLLNLFLGDFLSETYESWNVKIVPACVWDGACSFRGGLFVKT